MIKAAFTDVLAGLLTSIVLIASTVTYSVAVFSGPLSGYLQVGIGFGLIGAIVSAALFAFRSGIPYAIAGPDSRTTAILAALAAGAAGRAAAGHEAMAVLSLVFGTALTGVALYVIGALKMGRFVRFVPYPVVGGFMAASGWLLVAGAIRMLTGVPLAWGTLAELAAPAHLAQLICGIAFALALQFVSRSRSPWAFPALLAGSAALIDAFLFVHGQASFAQAQAGGWLLRAPAGAVIPALWLSQHTSQIDWKILARLSGDYAALIVVTAITLLLGVTSVEVDTNMHADIDVERELRLNGLANMLAAIPGGMVGTLSLTRTLFNFRSGGRNRISGLIAAAVCLLTLAFGTRALVYLPIPVVGGMLLYFGDALLEDWLAGAWKRMQPADFIQVCGILVLIVWFGFLAGIAAGVIVACMTFAVSSSRVRLVKLELTRSNYSSRVDRPPAQNAELIRHGERIRILRLHGFMFFGSANRLLQHMKEIAGETNSRGCRVVVIDFREVLGIDSTAVMSLIKLGQFAEREGILLAVSALTENMERVLHAGGFTATTSGPWAFFGDLDSALEWAEERLLSELMNGGEGFRSTDEWLAREFGSHEQFREFASYLETLEYSRGDLLFRQGEPADGLVLLHSGRVSVLFRGPDGRDIRVRSMVQQTILGEMGLYRARPRGASVYVEQRTVAYRLTNEALGQLELNNPALAHAFHKFVIRTLADRLDFANREISALQQ